MSELEIVQVEINLITKGTDRVRAEVDDDLDINDPDPEIGKTIIDQALRGDDGKSNFA